MMLQINQVVCPLDVDLTQLHFYIAKKCRIKPEDILRYTVLRKSLDARETPCLKISVLLDTPLEKKLLARKNRDIQKAIKIPPLVYPRSSFLDRPIIVGFGPAGMFAAMALAEAGCRPIILERGRMMEQRIQDVETFWKTGKLDPISNVQFGEGGAGTFSDGKLTTRIKDQRISYILHKLVEAGANPDILIEQHPHLGTDKLRQIVPQLRKKIEKMGGEFYFECHVDRCIIEKNRLIGVACKNQEFRSQHIIFAIGHSATDTYHMLHKANVAMSQKDFAVGVRVEHAQKWVNHTQYQHYADHSALKNAEYRLTHTTCDGRGVYTFCMCPGGSVVAASSSENQLVINGMSESSRSSNNANSAILVQVKTSDLLPHLFAGLEYLETIEKKAFELGGQHFKAPIQQIRNFLKLPQLEPDIQASYPLNKTICDLHDLFDPFICKALEEALIAFDHKMPGFVSGLLTAPETRSSSPLRIQRNENCESNIKGLYPCGEGAGYAGGIMSSALDGLRCAEAILKDDHQSQ